MQSLENRRPDVSSGPALLAGLEIAAMLLATLLAGSALRGLVPGALGGNLLAHLAFLGVPLAWLLVTRRDLAGYGLTLRQLSPDVRWALTLYLPVALGEAVLGFVDYRAWGGGLLKAGVNLAVLWAVGRRLRGPLHPADGLWMLAISGAVLGAFGLWTGRFPGVGPGLLALVTYAVFVGFGEEVLYRGYVQSRLNAVFGRPFRAFGVLWGWGLVLTAALFGLTHTGLLALALGVPGAALIWPWGVWTFVGGLTLGLVREKTGSVVAPALLHGLPQAVAAFWGF